MELLIHALIYIDHDDKQQGSHLLTWFAFNPSMDK